MVLWRSIVERIMLLRFTTRDFLNGSGESRTVHKVVMKNR